MSDVIRLATENYVNQEIPTKVSELENDSGYITENGVFIATYGKTTYDEVVKAYYEGKTLYCSYKPDNTTRIIMCSLQYIENGTYSKELGLQGHLIFIFGAMENGNEYRLCLWGSAHSKYQGWTFGVVNLKNVLDAQQISISNLSTNLPRAQEDISKLLPLLASSLNSFRGEFRNMAGYLEIKAPGIYLVLQGGSGNKTMTIAQDGEVVYKSPACNGWIVLSSDTGVVTPIGINSGDIFNMFETPGTYVGWGMGVATKITYPAKCVIWYLGNSNNE